MSCFLTARDMNDDGRPEQQKPWIVICKDNARLVLRPSQPISMPMLSAYN